MKLQKNDLIRELKGENNRCAMYMGFMYQVLQFTFVAIIALAVCSFGKDVSASGFELILKLVLPVCFYVFGVMYTFNAYALAVCGIREEKIHAALFNTNGETEGDETVELDADTYFAVAKNVATDRKVTMISYGVPLGFYLVLPLASIYIGCVMSSREVILPHFLINVLPIMLLIIYYILMAIIIYKISQIHFGINKIQNSIKSTIDKQITDKQKSSTFVQQK